MNTEALNLFCEVVRSRSFTRGARAVGISQSAASQTIANLEGDLGVILIDRTRRPLSLTPAGRRYYEGVRSLLLEYESLVGDLQADSQQVAGALHVVAIYSIGLHVMRKQIQQFMSRYPQARIRLEYLHPSKVVESVLAEDADLGLMSYPTASRALNVIQLRRERMVFVCPPGHHLATRPQIHSRDLDGENFVAFDPDLAIRKATDRVLRKAKANPSIVLEFDNIETIKQAVEIGSGVAILPEPTVLKEVGQRSLIAVPLAMKELTRPIGIIYRRRKKQTPAALRFVELLKAPDGMAD